MDKNDLEEKIKEIKRVVGKSLVYSSLVIALALGAEGCGKKSYCCSHAVSCSSSYVCQDDATYKQGESGVACIQNETGNTLECCECVYDPTPKHEPYDRGFRLTKD